MAVSTAEIRNYRARMATTQNLTLLVADDMEANRFLLRRLLEKEGFAIREAENGQEALEAIDRGDIDIALLDVMMPGINGFDVCIKIREKFSPAQLPVLFITAKTEDVDFAEGFEAGGSDYITKPINRTILLARLNAQVRLLRTTRALERSYQELARKKRMETLGVFASGIAHNFNNILGTVLGSAELIMMLGGGDNPDIKKSASLIVSAANRGALLVNSMLSFSRPMEQLRCPNPADVIRSAATLLPTVAGPNVSLRLDIEPSLPPLGIATDDLSQIMSEVLKNAAEAMDSCGEIVVVASVQASAASPSVCISVRDSGRGIPHTLLDHVFEPFFSTKNIHERSGISLDGSGLGLSTVYNLVTHANGAIEIRETGPEGTTIAFTLPIAPPEDDYSSSDASSPSPFEA